MNKVSIIVPAFNEAQTIGEVVKALKQLDKLEFRIAAEVIVVDDGSTDNTAEEAAKAGADKILRQRKNRGYGAAVKTGVQSASHDLIATFDADFQHSPADLLLLVNAVDAETDMVIGNRYERAKIKNQNSKIKEIKPPRSPGKWLLRRLAEFLSRERIPDLNCGLRIFRRDKFFSILSLLPDGFSFSTNLTLAFLKSQYNVKYVPVSYKPRPAGKSRVNVFKDGFNTIGLIFRLITIYDPMRVFLPASIGLFLMGFLYALIMVILAFNIPDGAVLLMVVGVLLFFYGLLAEQISDLRRQIKK